MNKTPAPKALSADRAGGAFKQEHAAEVTSDGGDNGLQYIRRESMGTAQGEGVAASSPIAELARVAAEFQLRTIATVLCDGPCLIEGGVITPLMPIAIIDSESEAGSWKAALPFCQQITQSDYPDKF